MVVIIVAGLSGTMREGEKTGVDVARTSASVVTSGSILLLLLLPFLTFLVFRVGRGGSSFQTDTAEDDDASVMLATTAAPACLFNFMVY